MPTEKNVHGLSRYIPKDVRLQVRRSSGFGCVVCGLGIYEYEHFDPEFKNATEHNPIGITLLCNQCHGKKTRGFLSLESIKEAVKNPRCLQKGFTKEVFDIGGSHPEVKFAGITFKRCIYLLVIEDEVMLQILPPEIEGEPFLISAKFTDSNGNRTLTIANNEWIANSDNWDIETTGGKIIIKESDGIEHLVLTSQPPSGFSIDKIRMTHKGITLTGDSNSLNSSVEEGSLGSIFGASLDGLPVGIVFHNKGFQIGFLIVPPGIKGF